VSDARLREAERRWREGGRLDDRLRWWSERARAGDLPAGAEALVVAVSTGDLDPDRVELAAYLGDERARALAVEEVVERVAYGGSDGALRVALDEDGLRLDDVLDWIGELRLWDEAALQRALFVATRHLADELASRDLSRAEDELEWDLQATREAERDRIVAATRGMLAALERVDGEAEPAEELKRRAIAPGRAAEWSYAAPLLVAAGIITGIVLERRAPSETGPLPGGWSEWRRTVRESAPDPRALRDAVRAALVPWALEEEAP
jgi:hypothetical protein